MGDKRALYRKQWDNSNMAKDSSPQSPQILIVSVSAFFCSICCIAGELWHSAFFSWLGYIFNDLWRQKTTVPSVFYPKEDFDETTTFCSSTAKRFFFVCILLKQNSPLIDRGLLIDRWLIQSTSRNVYRNEWKNYSFQSGFELIVFLKDEEFVALLQVVVWQHAKACEFCYIGLKTKCLSSMDLVRCANAQYNQTICTLKSHSRALPTFQIKYLIFIT